MFGLIKTDEKHLGGPCSNPGDNLITENAKKILYKHFGIKNFIEFSYRQNIDDIIDEINSCELIFYTVPTYVNRSYDILNKLVSRIKRPIIPLSGSVYLPPPKDDCNEFSSYELTPESKELIRKINTYTKVIPVRERLSEIFLNNNGFLNTKYVGDFGMYENGEVLTSMKKIEEVKKIVFTVGHYKQYKKQIRAVMAYIRKKFPEAQILYSTHHKDVKNYVKKYIKKYNFEIIDTSYDEVKLNFYKDCDLHIGYRVHGHIKCLSCGVPSILIAEDSRATGFKYTMGETGVFLAYNPKKDFWSKFRIKNVKPAKKLISELDEFLDINLKLNFVSYNIVPQIFQSSYASMIEYLQDTIPPFIKK